MKIILRKLNTNEEKEAIIKEIPKKELPLKKDGWQFNWRSLSKVVGVELFKITIKETPNVIEGILMIRLLNKEMLFMDNLEVAPHNYGSNGKYKEVAGCLIAFACKMSLEKGKGNYKGFLSFDSKTALIELYQKKYGAKVAMGHKMYFDPIAGETLMKKYLNIDE